jgi:hypothetical protein
MFQRIVSDTPPLFILSCVSILLFLLRDRISIPTIPVLNVPTPQQISTCQTCGGCYCIAKDTNKTTNSSATTADTCPTESQPTIAYSSEWIEQLRTLHWTNPLTLSCDPYTNSSCNTNEYPLPIVQPGFEYNCVVDFTNKDSETTFTSSSPSTISSYGSYRTRTFQGSVHKAQQRGLYVTHTGSCGMCSNLNDLSIYIDKSLSLRRLSTICAFAGIVSKKHGINCFQKLVGFTKGCSQIWYYNTVNTRKQCPQCFYHTFVGTPLQSSAPHCTMNDCLQCDENKSGPYFSKFAGRNRRNSGILTDIVRNCSDIETQINHTF